MNISAKGLAVTVVVIGGLVVGAYMLGAKRTGENASATQISPSVTTPPVAGNTLGNVPPNHDQLMQSRSKFTHFRVGNRNVKGMFVDDDAVWVGTSGGAIRYDLKSEDYKLYDINNGSLISNGVFHVSKLRGRIMVGTYGGGMSAFDPKTNKWANYNIPDGLADQFVYDITEDEQKNFWIATWSGVNFVSGGNLDDPKSWVTYTVENTNGGLPNDWVYGVEVGKNGDIWFATEGGLAKFDKNQKWKNWQHEDGLGAPYEKVKDDIAFTNDPAKTSKHHARQKAEQGLSNIKVGYNPNYIVALEMDAEGNIWCGTWGGGLSKFDGKNWTTYTVKEGLPGNHVFMLQTAKNGRLWIGTNAGLAQLKSDGSGFTVLTKKDGLYADNVFSLAEASDGSLWVGSFGGVARIKELKL